MPCGSSTSNSINILEAASSSLQGPGWSWKVPLAWLDGIARRWERRGQYRELLELDDRMLADVGLARTTVDEVRRSHLYIVARRDSR